MAHLPPLIPPHLYETLIHTPAGADYDTLVSVTAQPHMAVFAGLPLVSTCTYRKVVVRGSGQTHIFMPVAFGATFPRIETEPRPGFDFLVCNHHFVKNGGLGDIKLQWSMAHRDPDLRDALNIAAEMNVMTAAECEALLKEPALIEGGFAVGVYPGPLMRESLNKLVPVYHEFARRHGARVRNYDPVQRRCIAFMAERLETHFILKELRSRYPSGIPNGVYGALLTLSDVPFTPGTMP
jgi:hypothetical protein